MTPMVPLPDYGIEAVAQSMASMAFSTTPPPQFDVVPMPLPMSMTAPMSMPVPEGGLELYPAYVPEVESEQYGYAAAYHPGLQQDASFNAPVQDGPYEFVEGGSWMYGQQEVAMTVPMQVPMEMQVGMQPVQDWSYAPIPGAAVEMQSYVMVQAQQPVETQQMGSMYVIGQEGRTQGYWMQ